MAENGIILFRGKRLKDGVWVFGNLTSDVKGHYRIQFSPKSFSCVVTKESVGQFIGRKDNKLTKIFDGDIITVNGHYPKLVKFIPERAAFCLANICDFKNQDLWDIWQQPHSSWWDEMEIEVIGNKFDNPELLED